MGVGLLKPNVSAIVASLYPEGGARRDAGFSIFYMGINIGAVLGSLLRADCAAAFGWRLAASRCRRSFMALGVVQFLWTRSYLGTAGLQPAHERRGSWTPVVAFLAAVAVIVILALTRSVTLDAAVLATAASWGYGLLALAYFVYLLFFAGLTAAERKRALVMVALFVASVTFWAGLLPAGRLLQPVRRALYRPAYPGLEHAGRRAAGGESVLRDHARGRVRGAVDRARQARPRSAGVRQVRRGTHTPGSGFPRHVLRRAARARRPDGAAHLAGADLLPAHLRRAVPLARGVVVHEQARAATVRRAGDGSLVPVARTRRQSRRSAHRAVRRE